jgi:hypothetical protein
MEEYKLSNEIEKQKIAVNNLIDGIDADGSSETKKIIIKFMIDELFKSL